jgi:hypothetical protein
MGTKDVDDFKVNLFDYRIRTSTVRGHQETLTRAQQPLEDMGYKAEI